MLAPAPLLDVVRTAAALLLGYLAGSLPVAAWVARAAGTGAREDGDPGPAAAETWAPAGPGWGLLAIAGDLAKGVLPVALAIVTFGWWTGWAAAVGVVVGASRPAAGRWPAEGGIGPLAGACLALAPLAGLLGLGATALVALIGRVAGRSARAPAVGAGFATYAAGFLLEHADAARLAGLGILLLLALALSRATARQAAAG